MDDKTTNDTHEVDSVTYIKDQMNIFTSSVFNRVDSIKAHSYVFSAMERGIIDELANLVKYLAEVISVISISNVEMSMSLVDMINDDNNTSTRMNDLNRELMTFSLASIMLKNKLDMYKPEEFVKCAPDEVFNNLINLCPTLISEDGPYGNLLEIRNKYNEEMAGIPHDNEVEACVGDDNEIPTIEEITKHLKQFQFIVRSGLVGQGDILDMFGIDYIAYEPEGSNVYNGRLYEATIYLNSIGYEVLPSLYNSEDKIAVRRKWEVFNS